MDKNVTMRSPPAADVQMRAVRQTEWGRLDGIELVRVDRPKPLPTEILVRVKAASVNPVDIFTIEGKAYMSALSLPYIPGWDVSGVVEAVGYGVTRFQPGDEVFGMPWFPRAGGGYAEFVAAPARHFARKPKSLDFNGAAALPLAGLTAWQMLADVARVGPGSRVLVNGAGGGVGHLAVQIAKAHGAHVIAVARQEKHAFLLSLGADQVIDYSRVSVPEVVNDADVVIELVGAETCLKMLSTLRRDGLLVSAQAAWAPNLQSEASRLGVRASWYLVEPDHVGLEALADLVERGQLKVHVAEVFPLDDVAEALRLVGTRRTTGKVVLAVDGRYERVHPMEVIHEKQ